MILVYGLLLSASGLALVQTKQLAKYKINKTCTLENGTDVQISNGPLIKPCLNEIVLEEGQNYTLTCESTTPIQFRQQEISEGNLEEKRSFKKVYRNQTNGEVYQSFIDLYNIDQYAIGYYMCSDEHVAPESINNMIEEPVNNEHASYIYVYVNGTGNLFAPMLEIVMPRADNKVLIQCRPSIPDVSVELIMAFQENITKQFKPKVGFIVDNAHSFDELSMFTCHFERGNLLGYKTAFLKQILAVPTPKVFPETSKEFLENETIVLNCTATLLDKTPVYLSWLLPNKLFVDNITIVEDTNDHELLSVGSQLYKSITIHNATKDHAGSYSCKSTNACSTKVSKAIFVKFLDHPHLGTLSFENPPNEKGWSQDSITLNVNLESYPEASFKFLKDGVELPEKSSKYSYIDDRKSIGQVLFTIDDVGIEDTAKYTVFATNKYINKTATYDLIVNAEPEINFGSSVKTCVIGHRIDFNCDVTGHPLPEVTWIFTSDGGNETSLNSTKVVPSKNKSYQKTAYLRIGQCDKTGTLTCVAASANATKRLLIYDIEDGFGISTEMENNTLFVVQKQPVIVRCLASEYTYRNVTWDSSSVEFSHESFSHVATLKINSITLKDEGKYTCHGWKNDGNRSSDNVYIKVKALQQPKITNPEDSNEEVHPFTDATLNCVANGAPVPRIKWYKDGAPLKNETGNVFVYTSNPERYTINSTIIITKTQKENTGTYECEANSPDLEPLLKTFTLKLKVDETNVSLAPILIPIIVIIAILIILLVLLMMKVKKEKRMRKSLQAAGLLYFENGATESLNPKLGIDEQAEFLPYNNKFEFPRTMLALGKQLGAGAFGVVLKADARGIVNAEETTTVAVKMVKKTADDIIIKALASELKIMVHLGKHINIVNLLGACTKNVVNRELYVIVEYCKFGNIHDYLQKHREVFVDQLTGEEKHLGKVNRAYKSSTCGSTVEDSEYFGSVNTQETDNTFVNTANTGRSERKNIPKITQPLEEVKVSEGYVAEWRSNYEGDYSCDGLRPRVLTSRDLLAWAFQVARGMEYLAKRKILHGDLAARNVLLADDNVVKICDFGLARCIYKNEEYHAKTNNPMPVKWLAIECMSDRRFSTQSDVWSFGIVLWEMFSLAKTPYPNIRHTDLLQFLVDGNRLEKPAYSNDQIYSLMKKCWEANPKLRPNFTELQETLGSYLEENVRNFYVDLNKPYAETNERNAGPEDYLAMMSAPDYNNLVTPSPHQYVNERRFFPPSPAKLVTDNDDYLRPSSARQGIFSPREATTFDFDSRKVNQKMSEASSCGTELTPMLRPESVTGGSESDTEGESNAPPLTNGPLNNGPLNTCPRIDEETDEVFTSFENENSKNAKNIQSAVTNPTYITFDIDEKQPKNNNNGYINCIAPNGLVK